MCASLFFGWIDFGTWFGSPLTWIFTAFYIWMMVDAIRGRAWMWVVFMLVFPGFASFWYYLQVYRSGASATRGFELPGAHHRKRIRELQAQIHHLDKAHHHSQLGDIYFQQGKLAQAEACYRAALERDPADVDTRAHLGQTLLRKNQPADARSLLEGVYADSPKHDYGHSLMALAETYTALGENEKAVNIWQHVTANYSYPRAKVQLAELYLATGRKADARRELEEVINDDPHAPTFQRRRDKVWVKKARKLARSTTP